MKIGKSLFALRKRDRIAARLALREEWVHRYFLGAFVAPIFICFSVVDWLAVPSRPLWFWFLIRCAATALAFWLAHFTRARTKYGIRHFAFFAPYFFTIEAIMIINDLAFTPYFAGIAIVLFTASLMFPMPWKLGVVIYALLSVPTVVAFGLLMTTQLHLAVTGLAMTLGSVIFCTVNGAVLRKELLTRFRADHELRMSLLNREQEVRDKAAELMKRKRFESQFSPQVVARVLNNIHNYEKLNAESICTLVIDIKDSSSKSDALTPSAYAEVVEEVFDIIAACCLKWNITVDKFTGDGAQAFAGSPERRPDDLKRCVDACIEILKMLQARQDYLSLRWQGKVELRFGICEGTALVGFLGKGAMRSFTAIGNNVSLTHRLCAESNPNSILVHCSPSQEEIFSVGTYAKKTKQVKNLKGFEEKSFRVLELTPRFLEQDLKDIGRCDVCLTPLVMKENAQGIPQVICPACSNKEASNEANKVRPA